MNIRKIKDEELKRTNEVFGIAFEFPIENDKSAIEVLNDAKTNPQSRGELYYGEKWAAFDDENNMMAFIATTPAMQIFDGNTVKMTGIGGVSTLPQYRKSGAIRSCFNASLTDMYKNGYEFSYLYPFSTAYYNKFGYELCAEMIRYTINLRSIKRFDEADGQIYLVENGSNLEDIKDIYGKFSKNYNMMFVHEDIDYMDIKNANPAKTQNYTYVYKSKSGEPKGVMTFNKVKLPIEGFHFNMQCSKFYFSDMEGFKGLLNHTQAFLAYYDHIIFDLPTDIDITSFIPEWALFPYKKENYFHGMVRVINVKSALKKAKYRGDGNLTLKISDSQIPENDGIFTVEFKNNVAINVSNSSNSNYDISLSINDFSRFITGTHDVSSFKYIERLDIKCTLEKLEKVFYKKP
ncbi:MAG: GNAT family N-acetyltransferase, partial [Oscillospiraceae bacterium]